MRLACALGALLVCLAGGAHAAAQRVEVLDFVGPEFLPMDAPNAGSTTFSGPLRTRLLSGDGSVVMIGTQATDLEAGIDDLNGESDVWLLEGDDNTPRLLSRRAGQPAVTANGASRPVAMSRDGKRALFASFATDLVAGQTDSNNAEDLFLYDLPSDTVILVSRRVPGATATPDGGSTDGMLDATGMRVVFRTTGTNLITQSPIVDTNGVDDTYLLDLSGPTPLMDLLSNVHGSGVQVGNARSIPVAISPDGRFVAMLSGADAMVAGQLPGTGDQAFLEDRFGARRMMSHAAGNPAQEGNGLSSTGSFSDDGRFYAFGAIASNLVAGVTDTNSGCDIFLHDIAANTLSLITSSAANPNATGNQGGNCGPLLNGDGSLVAFASNATNLIAGLADVNGTASDVFVQEIPSRVRTLVSASVAAPGTGNDTSALLDFDSDGKRVLYESESTDLVGGQQDSPNTTHVFLYSLGNGTSVLASHREGDPVAAPPQRVAGGSLSADGEAVLMQGPDGMDSADDNEAFDAYLFRDGKAARITRGDPALDDRPTESGFASAPTQGIDASGRYVVFGSAGQRLRDGLTGATTSQLWIRDRGDDSLELVTHAASGDTVRADGNHGPVALSASGEWLAYLSTSTQLVAASGNPPGAAQVYLWNRSTRETRLVSHAAGAPTIAGNAASLDTPRISADGRFVAFASNATNLVAGQTGSGATNGFVWDRDTDATTLVTHAAAGPTQAAGGLQSSLSMTPDGAFLAFASSAADIASGIPDTNGNADVFLHERATGTNTPISRSRSSARMAFGGGLDPMLSADAARVVFRSVSNELQPGPPATGATVDVYLWTRADDAVQLLSHHPSNPAQPSNGDALSPLIDDAGRRVVFLSTATDLVTGFSSPHAGRSLFLSDLATNQVSLLSRAAGSAAMASNEEPQLPVLAVDGSAVAFTSRASNLVPGQVDPGAAFDVFRVDLATREVFLASHRFAEPNVAALPNTAAGAVAPSVSGNGLLVAFNTRGDDLVRHDVGGHNAFVYVHDEPTQLLIVHVEPTEVRVGEPYAVSVNLGMAKGPATGRVVITDGDDTCQFDIVADDRGDCELVSTTQGPKTLLAQFTSTAGFAPSSGTRDIFVLPPAEADIAMTMSAPASVAPGDVFELSVVATNAGPDRTGQARVDFSGLPEVLATFGVGWNCPAVPEFHCVLDILFVGEAGPLTIRLQAPPADAQLDIEASIASPLVDPDESDNSDSVTVQVDAAPEITQISPTSGNTEGGYPLQISGANFGTATGSVDLGGAACPVTVWTPTQIVCTVPSGAGVRDVEVVQAASALDRTTFSSFAYFEPVVTTIAPAIGSSDGNFPLTVNGSNFGASGASVAIAGEACTNVQHDAAQPHRRLTCTVPAGTGSNLPVVVTQSAQDSDGAARFAYAAVVSDLLIAKSSARSEVFSRNVDEWTILVSNLGPDAASGSRVVDVLPAHLTSVSWTCTGLAGASCGTPSGLGNIDLIVDLPAGGSALLQVTARIPRNPLLDLVNTATVTAPAGQADPAPGNNTDTETDPMATIFFDDFELE